MLRFEKMRQNRYRNTSITGIPLAFPALHLKRSFPIWNLFIKFVTEGRKPANTYNGREKTGRRAGGQPGHKGTTFTKAEVEELIRTRKCRHEIKNIGNTANGKYIKKYVIDLDVETAVTEIRIYEDGKGEFPIPAEYRSDVIYGANVKAMTCVLYSEGVMANDRIADFINNISNEELGLSAGSVYGFCKSLEKRAQTRSGQWE